MADPVHFSTAQPPCLLQDQRVFTASGAPAPSLPSQPGEAAAPGLLGPAHTNGFGLATLTTEWSVVKDEAGSSLSSDDARSQAVALQSVNGFASSSQRVGTDVCSTAVKEWDLMFEAVQSRLGEIAEWLHGGHEGHEGHDGHEGHSGRHQRYAKVTQGTAVQECVQALQSLHHVLSEERFRQRRLESEFMATGATLQPALTGLVNAGK